MPLRGSVRRVAVWPGSFSGEVTGGEQAAAPASAFCPWPWNGGEEAEVWPTCKREGESGGAELREDSFSTEFCARYRIDFLLFYY